MEDVAGFMTKTKCKAMTGAVEIMQNTRNVPCVTNLKLAWDESQLSLRRYFDRDGGMISFMAVTTRKVPTAAEHSGVDSDVFMLSSMFRRPTAACR
ncbi:hypothetical protein MRX96_002412 [Rhipicephalus microplus]